MSLADNYPVGMDFCTSQGLNGNCNEECYKVGDLACPHMDIFDNPEEAVAISRMCSGYSEDEIAESKKDWKRFVIDERNYLERKKNAVSNS